MTESKRCERETWKPHLHPPPSGHRPIYLDRESTYRRTEKNSRRLCHRMVNPCGSITGWGKLWT